MLPLNTQTQSHHNGHYLNNSTTINSKTQIRPSSPRQFFARIYGHLENNGNNNTVNNISENQRAAPTANNLIANGTPFTQMPQSASPMCDTNYQSDGGGSTSSPDISISDERCV